MIRIAAVGVAAAAREASGVLRRGGLVVIPTETVYGVAADPRIEGAERRIVTLKGRDPSKPIPYLAASTEAVIAFGARMGPGERRLAARFWPGALTLALDVQTPGGAVVNEGFRVPDCEAALAVLAAAGHPLRVTSANMSGARAAVTADEAVAALGAGVDLVLDDGPARGGVASSVVKIEGGTVKVLREGALPAGLLRAVAAGDEAAGDGSRREEG